MKQSIWLAVLLFVLAGCDTQAQTTREFHAVLDAEWQRQMTEYPEWASALGDNRYNDRWTDRSLVAIERRAQAERAVLERVQAIDPGALPEQERMNHKLFVYQYSTAVDGQRFPEHLMPFSHRGGVQQAHSTYERLSLLKPSDYEDWLARINAYGVSVDQNIALARMGLEQGYRPPQMLMQRVRRQAGLLLQKGERNPFWKAFAKMPDDMAAETRDSLRERAREAIAQTVLPAAKRLVGFFDEQYLPVLDNSIAWCGLPGGEDWYAWLVRYHTTTDLTPQQIHDIGKSEIKRIRTQMQQVIRKSGFTGSFAEFLTFLRTDPRFYHTDPEALLREYRATSKRIDPELPRLFGKLPRTPYGIRPIPAESAPDTTTAYYWPPSSDGRRAGYYYVNLYQPETRPRYEIEVLSVHEAVPGHHLQIGLASELQGVPEFRKDLQSTAFVEGWGLYSESLGEELGLYQDPYSKFGQLTYEMWRAVRLVVDTGMHCMDWSRQQSIDLLVNNSAKSVEDATNEIDRYIGNPGQALAYKIGELTIKELRAEAEAALGEGFDVRAFHDYLLAEGAMPLDVLQERMRAWIAKQQN